MGSHLPPLSELLAGAGDGWHDRPLALNLEWGDRPGGEGGEAGRRWRGEGGAGDRVQQRLQTEGEWWGAIAALTQLLYTQVSQAHCPASTTELVPWEGVIVSGPLPVVQHPFLAQRFSTWLMLPQALEGILAVARPLLPVEGQPLDPQTETLQTIPLPPGDPLASEQFCLVLTPCFSLSLVLGNTPQGVPHFQFSFDPAVNHQIWEQVRSRVAQIRPPLLQALDAVAEPFLPGIPDYRAVTQFTQQWVHQLRLQGNWATSPKASTEPAVTRLLGMETTGHPPGATPAQVSGQRKPAQAVVPPTAGIPPSTPPISQADASGAPAPSPDTELLKAMAHEIRTPLATIRTFTRSLLKRKDLPADAMKRLERIDHECTQQIDRFNLIFKAVELETSGVGQPRSPLSPISLTQIFQESIPLWQEQARRRNLTLEVKLPTQLPMVTSDPTMLNQVLTGLIDRFTHSLPPYSHIDLAVTLAGHQLKLQFQSQPQAEGTTSAGTKTCPGRVSPFRSVGQLLMFQPDTGGLSLNLNATKNLFQALGGKLIVKHRPTSGEVLTVFLPLETRML